MRILIISPFFYPHKGGSQKYAEELHYHLMKSDPSVKVDILTYNTDNSKQMEKYRNFTIYRIPCIQILKGQFAIPNYLELIKTLGKLKKNNYNFVNSHTRFFESAFWTPFAAKYLNTKSVLTDHCADHPTHKLSMVTFISRLIDKNIVPFFMKKYDFVIVTNTSTKKFLKKLGINNSQLIYGGVDIDYFKPAKAGLRKISSKNFSRNDIVISFVGRMIQSKGPHLLIEAAKKITKENSNTYFIFAGDGPELKNLQKERSNQIIFLGSLNKDKVADLMQKSDILVHPSLHNEGFPNVLLEAASSSCAIIATPMGGTLEIITEKTGIIIRPDSNNIYLELKKLVNNPKKRIELQKAARNWIKKNYSWKNIAKEYKCFIKTI